MKRILIATVLALLTIASTAYAVTTVLFNRNQVVWSSPLFGVGGIEQLPFTTYYIQDKMNRNTCVFVLFNNNTQQFTTTSVDYRSCPAAASIEFNWFQ